jgi:hypothetical protein
LRNGCWAREWRVGQAALLQKSPLLCADWGVGKMTTSYQVRWGVLYEGVLEINEIFAPLPNLYSVEFSMAGFFFMRH